MKEVKIPHEVLLFHPNDIQGQIHSYKVVSDAAIFISSRRKEIRHVVPWNYDADILFQMCIVKSISILQLTNGVSYQHPEEDCSFNSFLEPFSIYSLVRTQLETYCNFNNIYLQSKNPDEIKLKYDLWVLSGLLNRQKFPVGEFKDLQRKKEKEQEEIKKLKSGIVKNPSFQFLDQDSRDQLTNWKNLPNDWKLVLNGTTARYKGWRDLIINCGANDMFENSYRMLSLITHPSNVSVFQFDKLYINKEQENFTKMALSFSKWILSFFIRDFITFFELKDSSFGELPELNRNLINLYNKNMRGKEYEV